MAESQKKRLLILGGGYAGMTVARFLEKRANKIGWEVMLINRDNFFLFTPMLGEVATGSIETRHIINPIRQLCRRIRFHEREVLAIDPKRKAVQVRQEATGREEEVAYDKLVVALGSTTNFFNIAGLKENAITMKSLGDAIYVRNHVISNFEQADTEKEPQRQAPLVTFVVVGGGFAGVELAGELNDFAHYLRRYYPFINPALIRVVLVEAASRLLLEVGEDLAGFALQILKEKGMDVRLSARVRQARPDRVILEGGYEILTRTLIWTAGVIPQPASSGLPFQKDKRGRILVNEYLQALDDPDVWIVGDCCSRTDPRTGQPATAHVRQALARGLHVVTANKGPVAFALRSLRALAARQGRLFLHEGAVMDGTPVFNLVARCLPGARIEGFRGTLNSTTNLVLSRMEQGLSRDAAVRDAQRLGIAEADPRNDLDGWDAAVKGCALANALMGASVRPSQVRRRGIAGVSLPGVRRALAAGFRTRLVVRGARSRGRVRVSVAPERIPLGDPLSGSGPDAALVLETDLMGEIGVFERGATVDQTAYALLSDLLEIVRRRRSKP